MTYEHTPPILKEIELDFNRDVLYGWQRGYDPLIIELMKTSLEIGTILLPVDVIQINERKYHLTYFYDENGKIQGGGHHRARLGFELGKLRCNLRDYHDDDLKRLEFFPIQDINPISDE